MIVNIGLIALFWILLRFEREGLNVFGFQPVFLRLFQLMVGFLLTAVLSICIHVSFSYAADFSWKLNPEYGSKDLWNGIYYTFNSVLYEELIFRTYLLYKLLQLLGEKKAILITSTIFGIYHWFTFGLIGNIPGMIFIFFYTGLWGVMFAFGYTRMRTILFAIGLHWGWNLFDQLVFNERGEGLFKATTSDNTLYLSESKGFLITTLPCIVFAVLVIFYLTRKKPLEVAKRPYKYKRS